MGESYIPNRISTHQALGGGSVDDILLWRWWPRSFFVLLSASSLWFLFEYGGYNPLSFIANVPLLLVAILFFWAKSASLLDRPLPPIPDLEISDASAAKAAEAMRVCINHLVSIASEIAVRGNFRVLIQVAASLWLISYVGSLCDFITLVYIGVLISLSVPVLYDKYQDLIDDKLCLLHKTIRVQLRKIDESVLSKIPVSMFKEKLKKTQ